MINIDSSVSQTPRDDGLSPLTMPADARGRVSGRLEMGPEAYRILKDLAEASGTPIGDVLSKSVLLYKAAADASREGKAVGIASSADALETEFVGLLGRR